MSNLGLSVSDIVNVQIVMSPKAAMTRNFGSLLILGDSPVIDTLERIRLYKGIDAVAQDFGTNSPEYKAAALYFAQSPQPTTLYLGRWAKEASAGVLHGAPLSAEQQAMSIFQSITKGGFTLTVDGKSKTIAGVDLTEATNLNAVASKVATALGNANCVWNANAARFDITSATTGAASEVSVAVASDLSTAMGITAEAGAAVAPGCNAEQLVDAIAVLANLSNDWYGLAVAAPATDDQIIEAAKYIESAGVSRVLGVTTQFAGTLNATITTDLASRLKDLNLKRTFVQYSSKSAYAACSVFGRAFTVNFNGSNTTITLKFKQEPAIQAETLTESQAQVLQKKNCNVFVKYNNDTAIIQEGVMSNGYFFDEVHGTDWLQNDVQTAVYNLLYTSTTKIPQTDAGVNQIVTVVESRLDQAVTNGLVAPGVWQADGFGALSRGQTLSKGYYVYAPPVASQSQADREARKAPTLQAAIKLAGAVHFVDLIINVNR